MDSQLYMIVDLERCGDKCMFITEQVSSISENKNGLWAVRFSSIYSCVQLQQSPSVIFYRSRDHRFQRKRIVYQE